MNVEKVSSVHLGLLCVATKSAFPFPQWRQPRPSLSRCALRLTVLCFLSFFFGKEKKCLEGLIRA